MNASYAIPRDRCMYGFATDSPMFVTTTCPKCRVAVLPYKTEAGHAIFLDMRPQHRRRVDGAWIADSHATFCEKRKRGER